VSRLVDLSHVVHDGLVTYRGLPAPKVSEYLGYAESRGRYAPGTTFHIGRIEMIANTGTYVDAPAHRFEGRPDVAALPLESVANLPGVVIDAGVDARAITAAALAGRDLRGRSVLFRTGWSRHFATDAYALGHPFVAEDAAQALVAAGAALVGIDSFNIDDTADLRRPAHTALLDAGIPVCEHLAGLEALPREGFRFFAVPPPMRGLGTFTVRAFAILGG
jgi:kynurenine formamidase